MATPMVHSCYLERDTIHKNHEGNIMRKLAWNVGGMLLTTFFLFLHASFAQTPAVQVQKSFQLYYEVGPTFVGHADTFDSERKTRTVEASKGRTTYSAELTENEKSSL